MEEFSALSTLKPARIICRHAGRQASYRLKIKLCLVCRKTVGEKLCQEEIGSRLRLEGSEERHGDPHPVIKPSPGGRAPVKLGALCRRVAGRAQEGLEGQ